MRAFRILLLSAICLLPAGLSAHEVYVLEPDVIAAGLAAQSPNPLELIFQDPQQFIFWALIGVILVTTVFAMSITHWMQSLFNPLLNRLKPWAAPIARVTLGICLIASAYNNALFGPELPLSDFGALAGPILIALYVSGTLALLGLWTRTAGLLALAIFLLGTAYHGVYMTTYANYLGEIAFAVFLGGGRYSLDYRFNIHPSGFFSRWRHKLEPYAFPALRILFGISVAYAAYYAKFAHSQLALEVVERYHLTDYFAFEPLFVVLGALCVELLIGLFLIFGAEIRHTALFFLFWIFLSLIYFGEAVWPHLILVGVLISLFCHGYDKLSLEGHYFKKRLAEPVF